MNYRWIEQRSRNRLFEVKGRRGSKTCNLVWGKKMKLNIIHHLFFFLHGKGAVLNALRLISIDRLLAFHQSVI